MMSRERELLKRVISGTDDGVDFFIGYRLYKDIETFLAQPEQTEQEPKGYVIYKPEGSEEEEIIPLYTSPPKREPEDDQYYNHIKEHKEQIEADFKEQQSEERWYANSLGDGDDE